MELASHGGRKAFVVAVCVSLLLAVTVTVISSTIASSTKSADELLAVASSQVKALKGEVLRPHVFDSVDAQDQLAHISHEDRQKEVSFEHRIKELRTKQKQDTLLHSHEVKQEEKEVDKRFGDLPKRPAVFDSKSAQVQEHKAAETAREDEQKLARAEKWYAELSKEQEVHHEEHVNAHILRAQAKEAKLLKRDDSDKGSVFTSRQAEETEAAGAKAAHESEEAWRKRVAMYEQQAKSSAAKFHSTVHELAQQSALETAKRRHAAEHSAVYTSEQAEETQAEGAEKAEKAEDAWKQRVAMYRDEAAESAAAFSRTVHRLDESSAQRDRKAAPAAEHPGHVYGTADAGRAEEAGARKAQEREVKFRAALASLDKEAGRAEVRDEQQRAEREAALARRQAEASERQTPDRPALAGATEREARAVTEALGRVVARERRFESAVQREVRSEQEVSAEEARAVEEARAAEKEEQAARERRDRRAVRSERAAMESEEQREAEGQERHEVSEWPSAAS